MVWLALLWVWVSPSCPSSRLRLEVVARAVDPQRAALELRDSSWRQSRRDHSVRCPLPPNHPTHPSRVRGSSSEADDLCRCSARLRLASAGGSVGDTEFGAISSPLTSHLLSRNTHTVTHRHTDTHTDTQLKSFAVSHLSQFLFLMCSCDHSSNASTFAQDFLRRARCRKDLNMTQKTNSLTF